MFNEPAATLSDASPLPGCHALTAEQRAEFERNGFFIIPSALTPEEVNHYLAVADEADQTIREHVKGTRQPGEALELRNAVGFSPSIIDLMTHHSAFPHLLDLMGPAIGLTTSHLFIRPPSPAGTVRSFKQIDWHRDGPNPRPRPVHGMEPWLYTKIGYFLTDTTIPDAGALRVVPGSHRYGGPPPKLTRDDPHGAIEVKLKPGDAVVFENRVLHAVGPNYSDIARKNIYFGYCWRYLRPIDFITQPESVLAGADRFQRQLLGEASQALDFYLPGKNGLPLEDWPG